MNRSEAMDFYHGAYKNNAARFRKLMEYKGEKKDKAIAIAHKAFRYALAYSIQYRKISTPKKPDFPSGCAVAVAKVNTRQIIPLHAAINYLKAAGVNVDSPVESANAKELNCEEAWEEIIKNLIEVISNNKSHGM